MPGTLTQSLCRLCMGSCGMLVTTNEEGRLEAVQGDKSHPVSLGYACFTGVQSPDAHNSPDRLLHPLKRMPDGSFAEIPLEQALDEIADRLRRIIARDGGKAIGSFRGTGNPGNVAASAMVSAWHAAIGSAASFSTMTIDQSAKWVTAERLGVWGAGRNNFHESDVIMLVGGNPLVSNTVIGFPCSNPVKQLREARQRGTKLIVIDPRLTETAKHADVFLQPIPGEDVAVAAGLLRIILSEGWEDRAFCDSHAETLTELRQSIDPFTPELVEQRAGIAAAKLHEAARVFAKESRRGFVVTGTGPDMGPHSNLAEHLYESLNVVCGRYRRAGDLVVNPILAGPHRVRYAEVVPPGRSFEKGHRSRIGGYGTLFGQMMTCIMADEMLLPGDGQIRSLFVVGGNPLGALPDPHHTAKAFRALELLVVMDPCMTATARLAHYILPPVLQYERADCIGAHDLIHAPLVQYTPAIAKPPAGSEVVEEWYVFWALARRLGLNLSIAGSSINMEQRPSTDDLLEALFRNAQVPFAEMKTAIGGRIDLRPPQYVQPARPQSDGRFALCPPDVANEIGAALDMTLPEGFQHRLTVRRMRGVINTAYQDLPVMRRRQRYNPAYLHPDDLAALDLVPGDSVEIVSAHGRIPAIVEADPALRLGVVSMTHGWGSVLDNEKGGYMESGASTCFLVDAEAREPVNAMVRLTAIPVNIVKRPADPPTAGAAGAALACELKVPS